MAGETILLQEWMDIDREIDRSSCRWRQRSSRLRGVRSRGEQRDSKNDQQRMTFHSAHASYRNGVRRQRWVRSLAAAGGKLHWTTSPRDRQINFIECDRKRLGAAISQAI